MSLNEQRVMVNDESPAKLSRAIVALLNTCEDKPCQVTMEYLTEEEGLALSVIQTPYIIKQYIVGGYMAAYDFELVYRTIPASDSGRLQADEELDELVTWLIQHIDELDLSENIKITKIERQNLSALQGRLSNGSEDRTSALTINYERME